MQIIEHKNEIEIRDLSDFDLKKTFECGQCFRWDMADGNFSESKNPCYIGVAFGKVLKIRAVEDSIFMSCTMQEYNNIWSDYFDTQRNYSDIRKQLCIDDFMKSATDFGKGIRILKQDCWEALCSFIISQNNNIPRIISIINTLCRKFGDVIKYENLDYYSFPSAEKIANLSVDDLSPLRCGYRAQYLIRCAKSVVFGDINLKSLIDETPDIIREKLKTLHGVGDKVADCVMLFGMNKLDVFPVDVWMKRAVVKHYSPGFDPSIFNPYAGIAQQYIFNYMRSSVTF